MLHKCSLWSFHLFQICWAFPTHHTMVQQTACPIEGSILKKVCAACPTLVAPICPAHTNPGGNPLTASQLVPRKTGVVHV